MKRGYLLPLLCSLALAAASTPAYAQPTSAATSSATQTTDQRKAQEHFKRAKELYNRGSYREAVDELEVARKLDPDAKDLVMNLGIVYEKLAKYDEAITSLKSYLSMDGVTAAERTKAEGMIKRIEGAKQKAPPVETVTSPQVPTTSPPPEPAPHGRIDTLTIVAGSVAAVGLATGTVLGVYALSARPSAFVTGRDGSYKALQDKADSAHTSAVFADVGLGVGLVAAIATAWLYFGRTKELTATERNGARAGARIEAVPTRNGGAVFVGGTF